MYMQDLVIDILYFWNVYELAIQDRNITNLSYKMACLINFTAILAPYWIAYSGILALKYDQGIYDPSVTSKDRCITRISKFIFLSFLGPLSLLFKQVVEAIGDIIAVILLILTCNKGRLGFQTQAVFKEISAWILSLSPHSLEGVTDLEKTAQMFYEDIPMATLQLLILYDVLSCPELKENKTIVLLTFFKALANILFQFGMQKLSSKAMGEEVILHCL
jgi:hypothetical protein